MLRKIEIKNFRGIKNCTISNLGKINVLIGRNNSRKSSILEALCLIKFPFAPTLFNQPIIRILLARRAIERQNYVARSFWNGYETQNPILINLTYQDQELRTEIRWVHDRQINMYLEDQSGDFERQIESKFFAQIGTDLDGNINSQEGPYNDFRTKRPQFYNYLRNLTIIDDYLARNLERLETAIFGQLLEPRLDKEVIHQLNETYGFNIEWIGFMPTSPSNSSYRLGVSTSSRSLHIDELGDGGKYATVILSLCLLLKNSALLVEEVESHQHPEALKKFLNGLVYIASQNNVQLFITTHSFEVIQTLAHLPEPLDVRFFHVTLSPEEKVDIREFKSTDTKLISDLGVDLRNLEDYKQFVVLEGNDDMVFVEELLKRFGRKPEDISYIVNAGTKNLVKHVVASLIPTRRQIVAMIDYDRDTKEAIMQSFIDIVKTKNYRISSQNEQGFSLENGQRIIIKPIGLPNDGELGKIITSHSMEDYCLKLVQRDDVVKEWAGITLEQLFDDARKSKLDRPDSSKTLVKLLAGKKGMPYEDVIRYTISNAKQENIVSVIGDVKQSLLG